MNVEVLLSIMNQKDENEIEEFTKNMRIFGKVVVINQITDNSIIETIKEKGRVRIFSYKEKGLSKSRNIALNKQESDIGVIADDDVTYVQNYEEIIKKAYEQYPEADIIAFNVDTGNPERPIKKQRTHKVNFISAMRIQSIQITLRKGMDITFEEKFGAGSKYRFGEENIWLYDCLRSGKKIYYVNEKIGDAMQQNSTWYYKKDKEFMKCEGAIFYRISKILYLPLILQYAIRKRKEYKGNITAMQAIKYLWQGAKEYKKTMKT